MKFTVIAIFMLAATVSFAQLLPQKQPEKLPVLDRAMVFKVDYGDQAGTSADSSKSIGQPTKYVENENGVRNPLLINALCATGAIFSTAFDGNGSLDCFVIPSKKLRF